MSIFNAINKFVKDKIGLILITVLITNLMLFYSFQQSMKKIGSTRGSINDTTIIKKIVTPTLNNLNKFVYLEATILENGTQMEDQFGFDPDVPDEIQKGYMSLVESKKGGKYYIWSKIKIDKIENQTINGWFMAMNGRYQYKNEEEYYTVLIPIIEKKKVEL